MSRKFIIILLFFVLFFPALLPLSCVYEREYDKPQKIVFTKSGQIWTAFMDGSEMTQLTSDGSNEGPSWNSEGTSIVFSSDRDGNEDIFIMNGDGTGQRQLSYTSSGYSRYPTWMPDGNIIYAFTLGGVSSFEIMDRGGNSIGSVSATGSPLDLAVYRDGSFAADANGPGTVTVTDLSDGTQTVLTSVGGKDNPQWSYDGTRVFYTDGSDIMYVDVANPGVENIFFYTGSLSVNSIVMDPSGEYIYYALSDGVYRLDMSTLQSELMFSETGISEICIQGRPR